MRLAKQKSRKPIRLSAVLTTRAGSRSDSLIGQLLLYTVLITLTVVYVFPFLVQVATSFKTDAEAASDPISLIPQIWTTQAYEHLFLRSDFPVWFLNSATVTILVTLGRVFFVSLAGYALARLQFRGRGLVFALVVGVMAVPGVVLLIPKFLVLKQLGIYDSYAGMVLPLLVDAAGGFIMKQFFESIPTSLEV